LKTFKRFVRVAVLGAFAAGSLVVVAAPAGAHTITTTLLSCTSDKSTNPLVGSIAQSTLASPPYTYNQPMGAVTRPTQVKGGSKVATTCTGPLAAATGNLTQVKVTMRGNGGCDVLAGFATDGYTISGKLSAKFTNATSSTVIGHGGGPHPSWVATNGLSGYVALASNHPDITADDPQDVLSLLGVVTKGVAVGATISARAVGFDPYPTATDAKNDSNAYNVAALLACTTIGGGTTTVGGFRSFTSGTTNLFGSSITDSIRVGIAAS
jgi:hypothetical protein